MSNEESIRKVDLEVKEIINNFAYAVKKAEASHDWEKVDKLFDELVKGIKALAETLPKEELGVKKVLQETVDDIEIDHDASKDIRIAINSTTKQLGPEARSAEKLKAITQLNRSGDVACSALPALIKLAHGSCQSKDLICRKTIEAIGNIGHDGIGSDYLPGLIQIAKSTMHEDREICIEAIKAIGMIGCDGSGSVVLPDLIQIAKDTKAHEEIRKEAFLCFSKIYDASIYAGKDLNIPGLFEECDLPPQLECSPLPLPGELN